jgi:hypothetical protein
MSSVNLDSDLDADNQLSLDELRIHRGVEVLNNPHFAQPIPGVHFTNLDIYQRRGSGPFERPNDRIDVYSVELQFQLFTQNGIELNSSPEGFDYMVFRKGWGSNPNIYLQAADEMYHRMRQQPDKPYNVLALFDGLEEKDYQDPMALSNWKVLVQSVWGVPANRVVHFLFGDDTQFEYASKALKPTGMFKPFAMFSAIFRRMMERRTYFSAERVLNDIANNSIRRTIQGLSPEFVLSNIIDEELSINLKAYEAEVVDNLWAKYLENFRFEAIPAISPDDLSYEIRVVSLNNEAPNFCELLSHYPTKSFGRQQNKVIGSYQWLSQIVELSEYISTNTKIEILGLLENEDLESAIKRIDIYTLSDIISGLPGLDDNEIRLRKETIDQMVDQLDDANKRLLGESFNDEQLLALKNRFLHNT